MTARTKIYRNPVGQGFMRNGFFAWPADRLVCPGYTREGVTVKCGITFESYSGTTIRCRACRKKHYTEYQRKFAATIRRRNKR